MHRGLQKSKSGFHSKNIILKTPRMNIFSRQALKQPLWQRYLHKYHYLGVYKKHFLITGSFLPHVV